ncbi:ATP-binding protein [Streptomyces sp. NPDC046275]|uniref:ATP-binding protein n=1 Tax=Streptomyces sp. NPDC046275 TaxID=3157201 RepID=UPI0033F8764B
MTSQSTTVRKRTLADTTESCGSVRPAFDVSIERHPDPADGGMAPENAAWPHRLRRILRASLTHWQLPDFVETAELLLTELVTNALRHANGPTVGVRVYREGRLLKIEVNDGCPHGPEPRPVDPLAEHGRGLDLIEALAHAWGVSQDRTTTWCALLLPGAPSETPPAPEASARQLELRLPGNISALSRANIQGRTYLTLLGWPGNQHAAVQVLYVLVHNALAHGITPGDPGQTLTARLRVTETDELLIDVTDPSPHFPDFDKALAGERGRGLWEAQRLGARIDWLPNAPHGKTVRALLQPGQADL